MITSFVVRGQVDCSTPMEAERGMKEDLRQGGYVISGGTILNPHKILHCGDGSEYIELNNGCMK